MKPLNLVQMLVVVIATVCAANVRAELEIFKDYDVGESISSMTTIKVDANMGDVYLEGLRETWVASNEVAKDLGHIEDYHIYLSQLPESGDFNLVLIVEYKSLKDLEPSKARYKAFMKKWGEEAEERNRKISKTYPNVRTITGEYLLRSLKFK